MKNNLSQIEKILSPITGDENISEEDVIEVEYLLDLYKKNYDLDISYLIPSNVTRVIRYKCNKSGYRFYEPLSIVGDSAFYKKLQEKEWYYMENKWEFMEAINHIPVIKNISILEIGSAKGAFLNILRSLKFDANVVGLELNQEAAAEARSRGLNVINELSSDHAKTHESTYDVIASFQVLEHIPNPMDILKDSLHMLKPGGRLIIGVPDNSERAYPSIFVKANADLNMPPHHQGLWSIPSLSYLTKILPLQLEYISVEPATTNQHSNNYRWLMKNDLIQRFGYALGILIYAAGRPFFNYALKRVNKYLPAHTVLAIYKKIDA